ncbi:MAG TPA: hypothetical protein VFE36_08335 [Candidatus Baltobacteraceae bacterium]|nr:hypothetical protein [Candidatus Baltobacteraceae bacterium]
MDDAAGPTGSMDEAPDMAVVTGAPERPGLRSFSASVDVETSAEDAFALLCAVEKWPVWLSFLRSSRLGSPTTSIALGSEVIVRSSLPGEEEQIYEVDAFVTNFHLSLVGAYSVRRRLDFRIERKTTRSKVHVRLSYPAYHGRIGALVDHWRHGRRFTTALDDALVHFKGLVEYRRDEPALADV